MTEIKKQKMNEVEELIDVNINDGIFTWDDIATFMNSKSWYKSKTILFNITLAAATGAGTLLYDANFKELMGNHYPIVLTLVTMVNVYLRTITTTKVTA